jgi:hypothetical protein
VGARVPSTAKRETSANAGYWLPSRIAAVARGTLAEEWDAIVTALLAEA